MFNEVVAVDVMNTVDSVDVVDAVDAGDVVDTVEAVNAVDAEVRQHLSKDQLEYDNTCRKAAGVRQHLSAEHSRNTPGTLVE